MFAKIFAQIFDSSIAKDFMVRHVFMDLLVLADRDGVVDMTPDAIARRTNVPEDIVERAIEVLMLPDPKSRSQEENGARLILLDSHRDWGWQIVNYDHYRHIPDEETRKAYFRDYRRKERQAKREASVQPPFNSVQPVQDCAAVFTDVQPCSTVFSDVTQAEAEGEVQKQKQKPGPAKKRGTGGFAESSPKTSPEEPKTDLGKIRFAEFKLALSAYWQSQNPLVEFPWDDREGGALKLYLRGSPNTTLSQFTDYLRNRCRSQDVNHAERPSVWIGDVMRYAAGPLDRYGKPLNGKPAAVNPADKLRYAN